MLGCCCFLSYDIQPTRYDRLFCGVNVVLITVRQNDETLFSCIWMLRFVIVLASPVSSYVGKLFVERI